MRIRFTKPYMLYKPGDVVTVLKKDAQHLVRLGVAILDKSLTERDYVTA